MTAHRVVVAAAGMLFAMCLIGCDERGQSPHASRDVDASDRYRELLSRYEAANFRNHFRPPGSRSDEQEFVWTKVRNDQRFDEVHQSEGVIAGSSMIVADGNELSCYWASDDQGDLVDAACTPGIGGWREGIDLLLRNDFSARQMPPEVIGGVPCECFYVWVPILDVGVICLSSSGQPLRARVDVESGEIELVATEIAILPGSDADWLAPIIPSAQFGADVQLKQVRPSMLDLPESRLVEDWLSGG